MARHSRGSEKDAEGRTGRKDYIDALLTTRRPPPTGDKQLLSRIEAKTAQHRSPFSANISRKHASILSAMAPPEREGPKAGHKRTLTPTREASTRRAFEVFEWDRDFEDMELPPSHEGGTPGEDHWDTPPEPRPPLPKYGATLRETEGPPQEEEVEPPYEVPEVVPEAEDLIDEEVLAVARELAPEEAVLVEEAEQPTAPEPEVPPTPVVEATPPARDEVVAGTV